MSPTILQCLKVLEPKKINDLEPVLLMEHLIVKALLQNSYNVSS